MLPNKNFITNVCLAFTKKDIISNVIKILTQSLYDMENLTLDRYQPDEVSLGRRKETSLSLLCLYVTPTNSSLQFCRCIKSRLYSRDEKILLFALPSNSHVFNSWDLLRPSFVIIPIITFAVFPQNQKIFGIVQDHHI